MSSLNFTEGITVMVRKSIVITALLLSCGMAAACQKQHAHVDTIASSIEEPDAATGGVADAATGAPPNAVPAGGMSSIKDKEKPYNTAEKIVPSQGYYGNFCGPGYPKIAYADTGEELRILHRIQPIDLIDRVCKLHDMCYSRFGNGNTQCDKDFLQNMELIKWKMIMVGYDGRRMQNKSCVKIADSLKNMISIKHDANYLYDLRAINNMQKSVFKIPQNLFDEIIGRTLNTAFDSRCGDPYDRTVFLLGERAVYDGL